jgi:hypothetical protein
MVEPTTDNSTKGVIDPNLKNAGVASSNSGSQLPPLRVNGMVSIFKFIWK